MKLSMWMIANRLSPLMDISCNIRADAKPVLNSARLVYATNCVHVYTDGEDVIYNGEGDTITLPQTSIKEGFEILQGVFDYFQDWESDIQEALLRRDFQKILDLSWVVFGNPMILLDGNNVLLGISRQVDSRKMDEEWRYLCQYGYSSLNSVRMMRFDYQDIDFSQGGLQDYHFRANKMIKFGGVSFCIQHDGITYGRFTLLEKERPLNRGDEQLLTKLCRLMEPVLSSQNTPRQRGASVFYNLLFEKPFNDRELQLMMTYQQWLPEDTFQLACIRLSDNGENQGSYYLNMLNNMIMHSLPGYIVLRDQSSLILMTNCAFSQDTGTMDFFHALCRHNPIRMGISLPLCGIHRASSLLRQAKAALDQTADASAEQRILFFDGCAIRYLITCQSKTERFNACHPAIVRLWQDKLAHKDELFDTLKTFIDCERSLNRASTQLFTHRNTVLYRIKKCEAILAQTLDDEKFRYYLRLSMFILDSEGNLSDKPTVSGEMSMFTQKSKNRS